MKWAMLFCKLCERFFLGVLYGCALASVELVGIATTTPSGLAEVVGWNSRIQYSYSVGAIFIPLIWNLACNTS